MYLSSGSFLDIGIRETAEIGRIYLAFAVMEIQANTVKQAEPLKNASPSHDRQDSHTKIHGILFHGACWQNAAQLKITARLRS